jgi:phosphatidylinositol kinase/protein kinase (PI-3  family)
VLFGVDNNIIIIATFIFFLFQTSSDYDHLMLMQKVEVFEQAIEHTSGDDLAKVLWLKSPSSEVRYTAFS